MSLEWIKTPISEEAPGGPDLWEEDDAEFLFGMRHHPLADPSAVIPGLIARTQAFCVARTVA